MIPSHVHGTVWSATVSKHIIQHIHLLFTPPVYFILHGFINVYFIICICISEEQSEREGKASFSHHQGQGWCSKLKLEQPKLPRQQKKVQDYSIHCFSLSGFFFFPLLFFLVLLTFPLFLMMDEL
ncbi:hypothetical protein BJX70DRAFT_150473 [Aspergillus crustosus]